AVSAALRMMVPVTIPPPFPMFVKEKWKVSAFTGPAAIERKNADKIGTKMRPVTNFAALRFLRQPSRPSAARPVAKSGSAAGSGTAGATDHVPPEPASSKHPGPAHQFPLPFVVDWKMKIPRLKITVTFAAPGSETNWPVLKATSPVTSPKKLE